MGDSTCACTETSSPKAASATAGAGARPSATPVQALLPRQRLERLSPGLDENRLSGCQTSGLKAAVRSRHRRERRITTRRLYAGCSQTGKGMGT